MSTRQSSLSYRPHLDGLRAVAVVLVFIFHANKSFLQGGFIGVDVFFVLSGYLITRVFLNRRETNSGLGLTGFYARRARRLLPAMFILVTAVTIREAIWGSILDASTRVRDVVATLLYVANWNFIAQADDYFAGAASASPLRHTWSLAIEEQFYIVFPLLLLAALVIGTRRWILTPLFLGGLAAISAVLMMILYSPTDLVRVYYGTDTRAFQLLLGSVLGYLFHRFRVGLQDPSDRFRSISGSVAAISLASIVVMAATVSGTQSFYFRGGSLLVTLLTVALIGSTEIVPQSVTARLLSFRPAVSLGKISYGFYLYHWPVILWLTAPLAATFVERRVVNVVQFVIVLVVAYASYRFVETPVRDRIGLLGNLSPKRTIAFGLSVSVGAAILFAFVLSPGSSALSPGSVAATEFELVSRSNEGGQVTAPQDESPSTTSDAGSGESQTTGETDPPATPEQIAIAALDDKSFSSCPDSPHPCVKYEPSDAAAPTVVLIGDSTAQSFDPAMMVLAAEYGFRYVQAAVGGCPISHRLLATGSDGDLHKASNYLCWDQIPLIYDEALAEWDAVLFIATSWNEMNQHVEDGELIKSGTLEHHESVENGLRETIDYLGPRARIAFIDIFPPGPTVECLEQGGPNDAACSVATPPESREKDYNDIFARLATEDPRAVAISLNDVICPDEVCPLMVGGTVTRYDARHMTATASRLLAPFIADRLLREGIDLADLGG